MNLKEQLGEVQFELEKIVAMYNHAKARKDKIIEQIVQEENKPKVKPSNGELPKRQTKVKV